MSTLNPSSPIPLYHQFKILVEQKIATGEWPPESPIPTELTLVSAYGISRTPVRQALDELVNEGRIYRQRGRGTFVAPPKLVRPLAQLTGFAEELVLMGMKPVMTILKHGLVPAVAQISRALGLPPGASVLHIRRIVCVDGVPLFLDDAHFLPDLAPRLRADEVQRRPIYQLLEAAGRVPAEGQQSLAAVTICGDKAGFLGVPSGSPGLAITRVSKDEFGVPLEYTEVLYRGDRFSYTISLQRT
ncbi:MAG TPA: GntR family transcriptional regulator [Symbiobacteriaceae bacterium]